MKLEKKVKKFKNKYLTQIEIFQQGIGKKDEILNLKEISDDGASNTFNNLNINSNYLKKKSFLLLFLELKSLLLVKFPQR